MEQNMVKTSMKRFCGSLFMGICKLKISFSGAGMADKFCGDAEEDP